MFDNGAGFLAERIVGEVECRETSERVLVREIVDDEIVDTVRFGKSECRLMSGNGKGDIRMPLENSPDFQIVPGIFFI